jgi:hypothetical protein
MAGAVLLRRISQLMEPKMALNDRESIASASEIPGQVCQVFLANDIFVSIGVNLGEGLGGPDDICLGDIYELEHGAEPRRLILLRDCANQVIAPDSEVGTAGHHISLQARYTLMASDGNQVELMLLRETESNISYVLPLSPIGSGSDYSLVHVDAAPEEIQLTDLLCVSFARGTMITLGDGSQHPIEDLQPGMRVLTRDHGPQPLRWIGHATLRAVGAFAPVVITKGTLGNAGDLIVSQHHRMFLYQRQRTAGVPTAELLVQAKHLADGEAVFLREGGFVDYFSLVFDSHEIIYAEGIPAESLMVSEATVSRLPTELAQEVKSRFPGLSQHQHFGTEAGRKVLEALGPNALFQTRR